MKKTLIALAVLGATSSFAMAASNVTLYGRIDTGVVAGKADHKASTVSMNSGFRTGSRWGIKGTEDLGNGYQAGFVLEQGFGSDDGSVKNGWENAKGETVNGAFNRESKLFVKGEFDEIGFGRLGSLAGGAQTNSMLTGWAFGTSYTGGGTWTALAKGNGRLNNAVAYVSPTVAGLKVSAMYSNGITEESGEWNKDDHYYGIGAQYALGGFKNSLIFETVDAAGEEKAYLINLGLGYKLGDWTPMFAYQYNWQDGGDKDHVFGLSAKANVAGGTLMLGARYLLGEDDGATAGNEDKRRAWALNAAYEYPFSKRTVAWVYSGYAKGSKLLDSDVSKDNCTTKLNGYQVGLGLSHYF